MSAMLAALVGCLAAQLLVGLLRSRWRRRIDRPVYRARHGRGLARHRLHQ